MKESNGHIKPRQQNRDDSTRQRLIEASLDVFGSMGYEAATTRIIAQKAGVNLASIPYHFGGKENLYNAVVQFITDKIGEQFEPEFKEVERVLADPNATRKVLFDAFELIMRAFGRIVIGRTFSADGAIYHREQMQPTSAFDRIYKGRIGQAERAACRLVARLMGRPEDDPEAIVRAHALMGQIVNYGVSREVILRHLRTKALSENHVELILNVIIENCRRVLEIEPARKGRQS